MDNIFKRIKNPVQYLGMDFNIVKKDWEKTDVRFLLAFPDVYEIASSNLSIQILYHIINSKSNYLCDRIFAPEFDKKIIIEKKFPYVSLDNGKEPKKFDIIGFSLQYEMSYPTVLSMLEFMEIPVFFEERLEREDVPIICAGGTTVCNPLPMEPFFDFFLIGDGEEAVMEKCKILENMKGEKKIDKLKELSKIVGFYSPFFETKNVKRRIVKYFKDEFIPDKPVVPIARTVHNRAVIEISRGCTRGCRFCQAGMIYRPVREKSVDQIVRFSFENIRNTGYRELGLLSLSVGDYSNLSLMIENLRKFNCSLSLPSIRADKVDDGILGYIADREKTGFTVAPEAGSERLRKIINKNLTERDILQGVERVFKNGWQLIKLYFMVGLPFEEESDISAIVFLSKKIAKLAKHISKRNRITVSISPFVPKPHTPFQFFGQEKISLIQEKLNHIRDELKKIGNVKFKWHNLETSLIEAVISRGDKNISKLIYNVYKRGAYLDAWTDRFDFQLWHNAASSEDIDLYKVAEKKYSTNEVLPWDFIDTGIKKEFLIKEFEKAGHQEETGDCRFVECNNCGVCDGDIKNVLFGNDTNVEDYGNIELACFKPSKNINYKRIVFKYKKSGKSALMGQIDFMNMMMLALARTGAVFKFTQGFKPKMKITFTPPPPFGVESEEEFFEVNISEDENLDNILELINKILPNDITILSYTENINKVNLNKDLIASVYTVNADNLIFPEHNLIQSVITDNGITKLSITYDNGKHLNIVKLIKEFNPSVDTDNLNLKRVKFYFRTNFA